MVAARESLHSGSQYDPVELHAAATKAGSAAAPADLHVLRRLGSEKEWKGQAHCASGWPRQLGCPCEG